jgi:hypothetical protein
MGATQRNEALHRSLGHERRPLEAMESACFNEQHEQQHQPKRKREHSRCSTSEVATVGSVVQQQNTRAHRALNVFGLEQALAEAHNHFFHRHNMHNLGYPNTHSKDTVDRSRQGGV